MSVDAEGTGAGTGRLPQNVLIDADGKPAPSPYRVLLRGKLIIFGRIDYLLMFGGRGGAAN